MWFQNRRMKDKRQRTGNVAWPAFFDASSMAMFYYDACRKAALSSSLYPAIPSVSAPFHLPHFLLHFIGETVTDTPQLGPGLIVFTRERITLQEHSRRRLPRGVALGGPRNAPSLDARRP